MTLFLNHEIINPHQSPLLINQARPSIFIKKIKPQGLTGLVHSLGLFHLKNKGGGEVGKKFLRPSPLRNLIFRAPLPPGI